MARGRKPKADQEADDFDRKRIGSVIQARRHGLDQKQATFCEILKISERSLSYLESGSPKAGAKTIRKALANMDMNPDDFRAPKHPAEPYLVGFGFQTIYAVSPEKGEVALLTLPSRQGTDAKLTLSSSLLRIVTEERGLDPDKVHIVSAPAPSDHVSAWHSDLNLFKILPLDGLSGPVDGDAYDELRNFMHTHQELQAAA